MISAQENLRQEVLAEVRGGRVMKTEGFRDSRKVGLTLGFKEWIGGFPGGTVVENLPANAGDTGSSPGLGRSHMPRSN